MASVDESTRGGVYEATFDPSGRPVSQRVVEAVAAYRGLEPTALDPLYTSIDPDALDALLADRDGGPDRSVDLSFRYAGLTVTVDADGTIRLSERT